MEIENVKGYVISNFNFSEARKGEDEQDTYIQGLLLPKDKISRNGVLYDWESIKKHHKDLVNVPMMYNHETEGLNAKPVGRFVDTWLKEYDDNEGPAGWYYKARLNPNSDYYEDLKNGYVDKVSIQVNAEKAINESNGNQEYRRAFISDILEASAVPVPGFKQTSIEIALAEAFKKKEFLEKYNDEFKKGFEIEKKEHPEMNDEAIKQLVIDHLKKDDSYYIDNNADVEKEQINTTTASGGVTDKLPNKDTDSKEESDMDKNEIKKDKNPEQKITPKEDKDETKMKEQEIEEPKKDEETMKEQETEEPKKDEEPMKEQDDEEEDDGKVIKEEYEDDMSKVTDVLEGLKSRLDAIESKLSDSEESSADELGESNDEDKEDNESKDDIKKENEEEDEEEKKEDEDEPEAPVTEKADLDKSIKENAKSSKVTYEEAVSSIFNKRNKI